MPDEMTFELASVEFGAERWLRRAAILLLYRSPTSRRVREGIAMPISANVASYYYLGVPVRWYQPAHRCP